MNQEPKFWTKVYKFTNDNNVLKCYHNGIPIITALIDLYKGIVIENFPTCCVIQFVKESLKQEPSYLKRLQEFDIKNDGLEYVPCNKCSKDKKRKIKQLLYVRIK